MFANKNAKTILVQRFAATGVALLVLCLWPLALNAAPRKPHVITFGAWQKVRWSTDLEDSHSAETRIRPLVVDGRMREYTTGDPHEITDRSFVVRRAFRLNDALPDEAKGAPRWKWQPGVWLSVDRLTGHVATLNFPDFDPFLSSGSWFRDYLAYCGVSDEGDKSFAIVAQAGRKKSTLRKSLASLKASDESPACGPPKWERQPVRVSFEGRGGEKMTFVVRGRSAEIAPQGAYPEED